MRQVRHALVEFAARIGRWFFSWALVIGGGVVLGWLGVQHRLPSGTEWTLIGLLSVLAGILGMVAAVAWELTHVELLIHVIRARRQRSQPPHPQGHMAEHDAP